MQNDSCDLCGDSASLVILVTMQSSPVIVSNLFYLDNRVVIIFETQKEGSLLMYHSGLVSSSWNPCYLSLQRAYLHVYATKDVRCNTTSDVKSVR